MGRCGWRPFWCRSKSAATSAWRLSSCRCVSSSSAPPWISFTSCRMRWRNASRRAPARSAGRPFARRGRRRGTGSVGRGGIVRGVDHLTKPQISQIDANGSAGRVSLLAMSRSDEPFKDPLRRRGGWWRAQGRIGPDGRSSRDGTGRPFTAAPSTSPAAGTPARRQAGRSASAGRLLFGSFLWASRERNPRRSGALLR